LSTLNENNAIAIGQIQVWAESTLFDKGLNERELREWLLPICAKQGLNSSAFEYLSNYLTNKIGA
jgi:hypothetical protein